MTRLKYSLILFALWIGFATPALSTESMARSISENEITAALQISLEQESVPKNFAIKMNLPSRTLSSFVNMNDEKVIVYYMDYNKQNKNFKAEIGISSDAKQRATVTGRLVAMITVPVLNTQRNAGETIVASDIEWQDMEEAATGSRAITNPDALIGKTAQRVIPANTIIRSGMVASPIMVRKNTLVTIIYQNDFMSITNQVKAMQDGAMGDTVRVLNTSSNKLIDAVVSGSDQVLVGPNAASKSLALK